MSSSYAEPHCPHQAECPGCPGLGVSYPDQLVAKRAHVAAALRGYGELSDLVPDEVVPAEPIFGYRTRAKLVAQPAVGLGLYARGGHTLVDLAHCGVLAPDVAKLVDQLRGWVREGLPVDALDVASVGGAWLVTLVEAQGADAARAWITPRLAALPEHVHVALSKRSAGPQLLGTGHVVLRGKGDVRAHAQATGPYHYLTHGGFVQAHRGVASAIYQRIRAELAALGGATRPRVLELHAGAGALALSLAADGCDVTAVESFAPAVARLERAASEQRLNVEALVGDAGVRARELALRGVRYDAVLVNPPRRGLDEAVRAALIALAPRALIYVSCSAETLARDLAHFARTGLRTRTLTPFDMIPLTDHVENLAVLAQGPRVPPFVRAGPDYTLVERPPHADADWCDPALRTAPSVYEPPPDASGLCLFGQSSPSQVTAHVLARGITHKRGRLGALRYRCEARVGGHSLLHVEGAPDALPALFRALARLGHPVVGDRADTKTARHFAMRHGLDRPFAHVAGLLLADGTALTCPLAPDLAAVLASLRGEPQSA